MSEAQKRSIAKRPAEVVAAQVERMVRQVRGKPKPKEWREAMSKKRAEWWAALSPQQRAEHVAKMRGGARQGPSMRDEE